MFLFVDKFSNRRGYFSVWRMPKLRKGSPYTVKLVADMCELPQALQVLEEVSGGSFAYVTFVREGECEEFVMAKFKDRRMTRDPRNFLKGWLNGK